MLKSKYLSEMKVPLSRKLQTGDSLWLNISLLAMQTTSFCVGNDGFSSWQWQCETCSSLLRLLGLTQTFPRHELKTGGLEGLQMLLIVDTICCNQEVERTGL